MPEPDIVIAGGGPVGAALALGLRDSGLDVALLEARPGAAGRDDARTVVLSHGSRLILEKLGVWQLLTELTPIRRISVSQQRGFGRVELTAQQARVPALGYATGYAALQCAFAAALQRAAVRVQAGCSVLAINGTSTRAEVALDRGGARHEMQARLVAVADGGANLNCGHVRSHDYRQAALVCNLVSEKPHHNRAFERFTSEGPLALLPAARGWSLIWTASIERAQALAKFTETEFCTRLQTAFGSALGAFGLTGPRQVFPLVLRVAAPCVAPRIVLIGNAAQTLHPVAGQGLNLGLRDAWELARAIVVHGASDPGASALLKSYSTQRRFDRSATILFTDSLIRLFSNDNPLLDCARGAGLAALGGIPAVKNFLMRRMMYGARG